MVYIQIIVVFTYITQNFGVKTSNLPADLGLIKALKLTVALIWAMHSYLVADDFFRTIYFEFGVLPLNFYLTAELMYFLQSSYSG